MVVLGVTDLRGPFIVGAAGKRGLGQFETLSLDAARRGLPLATPTSDTVERAGVTYADIERAAAGPLRQLAALHRADAVLAGTMIINSDGYWGTTWTLLGGGGPMRWSVPATTFDRAIGEGLGRTARALAGVE